MIRNIQNRIILLIVFIGTAMVIGIFVTKRLERQRIDIMLNKEKIESSLLLNRVVNFKSKSLTNFIYDYTFWDEMVSFTKSGDSAWAIDNIFISMPTFNIQYAWVFRTDLSLLYSANSGEWDALDSFPLSEADLKKLTATGAFYDFYVKTPSALVQMSGGSIHPSNDPGRKTAPNGYFFVARVWTEDYIADIKDFTGTKLDVLFATSDSIPADSIVPAEFKYINYRDMRDWEGALIANLRSAGTMETAREFGLRSHRIMTLLVIFLILILSVVALILTSVVIRPLKLLIRSLVADNPDPIQGFLGKKSEFGHIARLMNDFFLQKKKLIDEIDERKKVERELILAKEQAEESDRLKTAFLNNLSHEIRTPMNAIVGFSELIADPVVSIEEKIEFSGIISESILRLLGIITDLISISKIDTGQMDIVEEKVDLVKLLNEVFTEFEPRIDKEKIAMKVSIDPLQPEKVILSDYAKLQQALRNLINNSIKFTKTGSIEFGYLVRGSEIEFFVKDTGVGIPLAKSEHIFAKFQQADDSLSREFGGTGLGLPISKAYIELLGGRIWFDSEENKGTQFYFTLPNKTA